MAITVPIISEWNKTQLQKAQKDIETFGSKAGKAFNGLASAGKKLALGLAGVSVAAIAVGKDLVEAGERASTSNARIDQITESMGLFGERTGEVTERLKDLANETARKTGIDQNQIKQAQATLLTFKDLAWSANDVGGNFDRATQAALDLASAGFGSAESNAVALGKALNDPIAGLSALARSGVTFSEAEKEVIATLVESGNTYKAQQLILEAIEKQVGGTAEATANSSDKMRVAFSQLQERVGLALLPVFEKLSLFFIDTLVPTLERAYNTVIPAFRNAWQSVSDAIGPLIKDLAEFLGPIIERIITFLKENTEVVKVFMAVLAGAATLAMIAALVAAIGALFNPVTLIIGGIAALAAGIAYAWNNFETFRNVVTTTFSVLRTTFTTWWTVVKWVFDNVFGGMDGIRKATTVLKVAFQTSFNAIKTVVMSIYNAIQSVISAARTAINTVSTVVDKAKSIPGSGIVSSAIGAISGILPFAEGGIVTGPTVGLVGEAGPEAIIPLDKMGSMGGTTNITINMPAGTDGDEVIRALQRHARNSGALALPVTSLRRF